jgi:hypothetical protein
MGDKTPGQFRDHAPPFSRAFTTTQADLTSFVVSAPAANSPQVAPYRCAASGATLIVTTVSPTFAYTNCAGETVTVALGAAPVGTIIPLPVGMIAISTITNCTALVYWHGTAQQGSSY